MRSCRTARSRTSSRSWTLTRACGIAGSRITISTARSSDRAASSTRGSGPSCGRARGASGRRCAASRTAPRCAIGTTTERRVDLAIGAALAIRRALFDEIGTFDERFFLYHEEVDFAKRAATQGWEMWFVPLERCHSTRDMGSASGQYNVERRKQRSRAAYWIKHHGRGWYALSSRRFWDGTCCTLDRGRCDPPDATGDRTTMIAPEAVVTFDHPRRLPHREIVSA